MSTAKNSAPEEPVDRVVDDVIESPEIVEAEPETTPSSDDETPVEAQSDELDLAAKNKSQLTELLAELLSTKPVQSLRRDTEAVKVAFYKLHRLYVEAAR